jgi:hypothetical protein
MCWAFCFVRTKHGYSSLDTLIVKTVQYGALKTHMRSVKVLCIRQNWCFMRSVSKMNCGTIVL